MNVEEKNNTDEYYAVGLTAHFTEWDEAKIHQAMKEKGIEDEARRSIDGEAFADTHIALRSIALNPIKDAEGNTIELSPKEREAYSWRLFHNLLLVQCLNWEEWSKFKKSIDDNVVALKTLIKFFDGKTEITPPTAKELDKVYSRYYRKSFKSALTMPTKSRFVASFENEIIDKLFPHKSEGVGDKQIIVNKKTVGEIHLEKEFEAVDIWVYMSFIFSLNDNNKTDDGDYYYICKDAFCRKFFGIKNEKSPITKGRKQIIEDALERLRSAYFLNIKITKENGIKQVTSYEYCAKTNEPYLPLHGKDIGKHKQTIQIGSREFEAWFIPVNTRLPIKELGLLFKRLFEPKASIMPRDGTNIDSDTANLFATIYRECVTKWFPEMNDSGKIITLEKYYKGTERKEDETDKKYKARHRNNKLKFVRKLAEGLKQWQRDGLCVFAVGEKHSNGKYSYFTKGKPNNLLTWKGEIESVMIIDVPRNNEAYRQITE